jgi:hypothetical protein
VDSQVATLAEQLRTQLTGDPAHQFSVQDAAAGAQGAAADDGSGAGVVTEVQRLRCMIDAINAATAVHPKVRRVVVVLGCCGSGIVLSMCVPAAPQRSHTHLVAAQGACVATAHNHVVPNRLFGGLAYPDKLESYVHREGALEGPKGLGLAADVRGSWAVHADSFKGVTVLRSLLFPGYAFYYSAHTLTWGGLYVGDGLQNTDLVFML